MKPDHKDIVAQWPRQFSGRKHLPADVARELRKLDALTMSVIRNLENEQVLEENVSWMARVVDALLKSNLPRHHHQALLEIYAKLYLILQRIEDDLDQPH